MTTATELYFNRELSLLAFQERVLALAENPELPLLERAKFVAIVSSNLDEFFQVRVSGLKEQVRAGVRGSSPDGLTAHEQLEAIAERVRAVVERRDVLVLKELLPGLEAGGIRLASLHELSPADRADLDRMFEEQMFPVLTPLAVDPSHPFPYISDLSLNLAVMTSDREGGAIQFARVKVPPILPRFVVLPDGERFVALEHVIADHLGRLFPGREIVAHHPFRVTRNADLAIEQLEAEDLLEAMEEVLLMRQRSTMAVRLEAHPDIAPEALDLLQRELDLSESDIYLSEVPLDLTGLWALYGLNRPDLKDVKWTPVTQPALTEIGGEAPDFFELLRSRDLLVQVPYESFATSTARFLAQAARDPNVLAIKQTLYRTSMADDPALGGEEEIVRSLVGAAQAGKQVVVLVELKARFDEEANIRWARILEESGAHVVYGVAGLKTHSKIALVVRREGTELRRYCTIGTGNYNPKTARLYEDLHLFTADHDLGADLSDLFNVLTGAGAKHGYRKLWVAPTTLRPAITANIRRQAELGTEGRLTFKLNHLVDPAIIDELYAASNAGVDIRLVVRGNCCLRPGVPGMSENITVRSVVGEFLEHSRIYSFGHPGRGATYHIGSADLMQRNLNGRVEAVTPVTQPDLADRLQEILDVSLADDVLAWELESDGSWHRAPREAGVNAQEKLKELAIQRSLGDD